MSTKVGVKGYVVVFKGIMRGLIFGGREGGSVVTPTGSPMVPEKTWAQVFKDGDRKKRDIPYLEDRLLCLWKTFGFGHCLTVTNQKKGCVSQREKDLNGAQ